MDIREPTQNTEEGIFARIADWLPQSESAKWHRSYHFWITAVLMVLFTFIYYIDQTFLSEGWPFNLSLFTGVHDFGRTLFFIPIVYAAMFFRVRGSLVASAVFLVVILPRALFISPYEDPLLRPLLFVILAAFIGLVIATQLNRIEKGRKVGVALSSAYNQLNVYHHRLQESEKRLRMLSRRMIDIQEEEKARLARELHDQLGQAISALKIEAVSLAEQMEAGSPAGKRARDILDMADQLVATIHRISVGIRPSILDKLGLPKAVEWYAEEFERRTGISCPVDVGGNNVSLPPAAATAAYRILQEALTNVSRHASASQASVGLSREGDWVKLSVFDNGVGMNMGKLTDTDSLGILGMRERAQLVGGRLEIKSHPEQGTQLAVFLPVKQEQANADAEGLND